MKTQPLKPLSARAIAQQRQLERDAGITSLDLVIVTPALIVLLLIVVALGRFSQSHIEVENAADAAARAAALTTTPTAAQTAATQAAAAALADSGVSCLAMDLTVNTSNFQAGGSVTVQLSCTAYLSDLSLAGLPGQVTVTTTSAAVLETYRPLNLGAG